MMSETYFQMLQLRDRDRATKHKVNLPNTTGESR